MHCDMVCRLCGVKQEQTPDRSLGCFGAGWGAKKPPVGRERVAWGGASHRGAGVRSGRGRCSGLGVFKGSVGLLVGVVAGTHHGTYGGVGKAHLLGFVFEHFEGVGVNVAAHGQVAGGGREVLADGEHLHVVCAHVTHDCEDFFVFFA